MLPDKVIDAEFYHQSIAGSINDFYCRRCVDTVTSLYSVLAQVAQAKVDGKSNELVDVGFRITYEMLNKFYHQYGDLIYVDRCEMNDIEQCSVAEFKLFTMRITDDVFRVTVHETERSKETTSGMSKAEIIEHFLS